MSFAFLGLYLGMNQMGNILTLFSFLEELSVFQNGCATVHFTFPPTTQEGFYFPRVFVILVMLFIFIKAILAGLRD